MRQTGGSPLTHAGLSAEDLADILTVDPKTVHRWISSRTPYARHHANISRALNQPEHQLWPDTIAAPKPPGATRPNVEQSVGMWPSLDADTAPDPVALLAGPVNTSI